MSAERLKDFPAGPGAREIFPWEQWVNGEIWKLSRGTGPDADFVKTLPAMRTVIYAAAKRRGLSVRTRAVRDGQEEALVVQFAQRDEHFDDATPKETASNKKAK